VRRRRFRKLLSRSENAYERERKEERRSAAPIGKKGKVNRLTSMQRGCNKCCTVLERFRQRVDTNTRFAAPHFRFALAEKWGMMRLEPESLAEVCSLSS